MVAEPPAPPPVKEEALSRADQHRFQSWISHQSPEQVAAYKTKDQAAKRAIQRQWTVDKSQALCMITQTQSVERSSSSMRDEGWYNKFQIADIEKINVNSSMLNAAVTKLKSRPHPNPAFAGSPEMPQLSSPATPMPRSSQSAKRPPT